MTVNVAGLFDQMATLQRTADDALRAKGALLEQAQLMVDDVGPGLAEQMDQAETLRRGVFEALRPYSGQFGRRAELGLKPMPADVRGALVEQLDEVMRLHDGAIQSIDDAFGSGNWISNAVTQSRGFGGEARRVIADPNLGPRSADQAIDLLRSNGYAYDEARIALRNGDLDRIVDAKGQMARQIDVADETAFAGSEVWRTAYDDVA
jgi:hypothetical protein